jgi:hypothetical protein
LLKLALSGFGLSELTQLRRLVNSLVLSATYVHYQVLTGWTEVISMDFSRFWRFTLLVAGLACLSAPASALITVGSLDLLSTGTAIVAEDGLAYIGISGGFGIDGLVIADISNPNAPVEIGAIDYGPSYYRSIAIRDVVVEGGLAYLTVERAPVYPSRQLTGSLWIVDVSDPTAPVEIGDFEISHAARGIAVVDNLAYLTFYPSPSFPPGPPPFFEIEPSGMHVIDVANPSAPVQVGNIEFSRSSFRLDAPYEIEVLGDLAYIADTAGLRTVDVSDPTAPVEIDLAVSSGRPNYLTIVDGLAYAASPDSGRYPGGLSVFDLSDPRAPIEIGFLQLLYGAWSVAVEGETAYVAAQQAGLRAIDVSDPEAPAALGSLATPYGAAAALAVTNGLAYVLDGYPPGSSARDLHIIDLSIPTTPIEVGTTTVSGTTFRPKVAVVGDLAYVTVGEEGLRVIDVSNPATPVAISAIDTPGFAAGATGVNSVAYIADGETGLRIFDFAKPTAPVEISAIDTPGFAGAVEVVNGLAYVADGDSGLRVIDVSNPEQPVEIGALDTPGLSQGIAVSGGRAYLADGREGLRIIDVSNPEQPVELGFYTPPYLYNTYTVAVVGEIAYLGAFHIRAVDVTDPTAPLEVGAFDTYRTYGEVFDLVVAEGLVYAIRHEPLGYPYPPDTRLMIVDFGPEYSTKISVEIDVKPGSDSDSINPASRGVIPVAILGSESFDVTNIDLTTLTFGPDGATPAHRRGGHAKDVNGDGAMDLVSHFRIQDTGITSKTDQVCVSGKMLDAAAFEGCSAIRSQP